MNIGELFVSLGIKGSDKTLGEVTNVKKGLKETASEGLAAKAAILGAVYALERLFTSAGNRGADLANFSSLIGESSTTLQRYQYAARQAGVSNQEVANSFATLQEAMAKVEMNEGAPRGLQQVSKVLGRSFDRHRDIQEWARHPEELLQVLQAYAQKEQNTALRNQVLASFGLGPGMIAALAQHRFTADKLGEAGKKGFVYSDAQVKSLQNVMAQVSNLETKVEMTLGKFAAKHGGEIIHDIQVITDAVLRLIMGFELLAEKLHVFDLAAQAINAFAAQMAGIDKGVSTTKKEKGDQSGESFWQKMDDDLKIEEKQETSAVSGALGTTPEQFWTRVLNALGAHLGPTPSATAAPAAAKTPSPAAVARPAASPQASSASTTRFDIKVHQTFGNSGAPVNAQETADAARQGIRQAFRQIAAYGQVT